MKSIQNILRDKDKMNKIIYKIHQYSSYASSYSPSNILLDTPSDVNLRWSTTTNDHRQYLILEYDPSIVSTITFGKFNKIHVCNIKEMKISVSFDNKKYIEIFYGGLKNDTINETHNLLYYNGEYIISKYMKIEPLASWGMNFNYTIWYVELKGITDMKFQDIIDKRQMENDIKMYKNIVKKYTERILRQENQVEKFINKGQYEELEEYIKNMDIRKFYEYVNKSKYTGKWEEIKKNKKEWPCARGGHQMICNRKGIYLYGGWDGLGELGDLWVYNETWKCIHKDNINNFEETNLPMSHNINLCGGTKDDVIINITRETTPGKRSCHKMCTDGDRLFLTGKYIPTTDRNGDSNNSELWIFDDKWVLYDSRGDVTTNMYDHYLLHTGKEIYMFGGKTTNFDDEFGGLYKVEIDNKNKSAQWTKLLDSKKQSNASPTIKGRLGHVTLHIDTYEYPNTLAIIGGQRGKEYFKSISLYSLDTWTVYESIPFPINTDGRVLQRSILYNNDIIVLFTYGKDKESRLDISKLYSYSLIYKTWNEVEIDFKGPMPRTAHQFIFWVDKFYLFGGNVVDERQNDFWTLDLTKMSYEDARRCAIMTVRKHKFLEMYKEDTRSGLKYLRSKVKECVVDKYTKRIFEDTCYEIFERTSDTYEDIKQYINE
ncbi:muskelin-like protein [Vairimorpha necatrix]|uniref:Muskelin-like protein n=1 Tax=Vairimorpha necatrix TaxID=6039 RepID=A0AAX4JE45_9MICR